MASDTRLISSLCAALLASMLTCSAHAENSNARFFGGNLSALQDPTPANAIAFALQTPWGRETFRFVRADSPSTSTINYHGSTSLRADTNQRTKAALTSDGRVTQVFFTSRRTGRPAAATLFHTNGPITNVRISKINRFTNLPCGHPEHANSPGLAFNGLGMYRAAAEGQPATSTSTTPKFSPTRVLEVSAHADAQFLGAHGKGTERYIQATMNAAGLLYMDGLGLRMKTRIAPLPRVGARSEQSYDAERVLEDFRLKQLGSTDSADLHHLFTGKLFNDTTIGLAYVATACAAGGSYAVGLSRSVKPAIQPLVMAHELAHGLSAVHDAIPFSLMNPAVSPLNTSFSEETKADIYQFVTEAAPCIEPDLTPSVGLDISANADIFTAEVPLQSWQRGTCSVSLQAAVPPSRKQRHKGHSRAKWITVTTATVEIPSSGATVATGFSTISPTYLGKGPKTYSFRSVARCSGATSSSKTQRVAPPPAGASTLTNTKTKDWLSSLISNFQKN